MKVQVPSSDLIVHAPAIWFHEQKKKKKKDKDDEEEKDTYVTFDVPINKKEEDGATTEWSVRKYESGTAEEYIKWRIRFDELAEAMDVDTPQKKYTVLQTLLRGEARARFNAAYLEAGKDKTTRTAEKQTELEERKIKAGFSAVAKQLFQPTDSAWRRQKTYLRYHLSFNNLTVNEFKTRLMEMNKYLTSKQERTRLQELRKNKRN